MKVLATKIILLLVLFWSSQVYSLTEEQKKHEQDLTEIATERCRSELVEGQDFTIKVLADGKLEVSFFGKKEGGLKGSFIYEKSDWEGRQRVLREHQANENKDFRACKKDELRSLRESYKPPLTEGTVVTPPPNQVKTIEFKLARIIVNFDCDSGNNGGDFEGLLKLRLPNSNEILLANLDVIDGVGHDTSAGVREGGAAILNRIESFQLMPGETFTFYGNRIIETTGNDHEFDDNPIRLNETYSYEELPVGNQTKELDDGGNCKLTFVWNIRSS